MGKILDKNAMRTWCIYKITSPVGRVYIGVTCNVKNRFRHYRRRANRENQPLLQRSFDKHGVDQHVFDIIETFCSTLDYALGKEMFWIRSYMSNRCKFPSQNGLNLTDGGQGIIGYKMSPDQIERMRQRVTGFRHTEEAKKKIGEASIRNQTGKKLSEVTKEKIRQANLGKKYSEDVRKRLSEMRKGKKIKSGWTEEKRQKMSEMKKQFRHTDEAKRKIGEAAKGNKHNAGRKQTEEWKQRMRDVNKGNQYCTGRKLTQEHKDAIRKANTGRVMSQKAKEALALSNIKREFPHIIQYDLKGNFIAEHPSIKGAARSIGVSPNTIREILSGETKKPKNFIFKYKD